MNPPVIYIHSGVGGVWRGLEAGGVNSYFRNEAKCPFFVVSFLYIYINSPFEKYHNTISWPSKIFCEYCFQFPLGLKSGGGQERRKARGEQREKRGSN